MALMLGWDLGAGDGMFSGRTAAQRHEAVPGGGFPWEELCLNQRRRKEKVEMSSGTRIRERPGAKTYSGEGLGCHTGNWETRIGHEEPARWGRVPPGLEPGWGEREPGPPSPRRAVIKCVSGSPSLVPTDPRGSAGVCVQETLSAPQSPTGGRAGEWTLGRRTTPSPLLA